MIAELRELTRPCKRCKGSGRLPFTATAVRVLELVRQGLPNKQIAARIGKSEETVSLYKCGRLGNRKCWWCKGRGRIPVTRTVLRTLNLLREGLMNKEIAARLGTTVVAVKTHVSQALRATGFDNRTQLALFLKGEGNPK